MRRRVVLVVGALVAGGCGGSEACADLGHEVLLSAVLTDNGERTRVEVELRRADLGAEAIPVKLCEDNALRVDEVVMTQVKRPTGAVVYEADLAEGDGSPTERRFRLDSEDGASEFTAKIDAPAFTITAPTADSVVSRAAALTISWDPPRSGDATMAIKVADAIDGDACLGEALELEEPDDGELVIGEAEVKLAMKMAPSDGMCAAFVSLSRTHSAALEPTDGAGALHPDSRVQATTSRTVTFTSAP